ncbi:unnamed protein product, partial [Candidula unifasciata]
SVLSLLPSCEYKQPRFHQKSHFYHQDQITTMAELMKLIDTDGAFKSALMQVICCFFLIHNHHHHVLSATSSPPCNWIFAKCHYQHITGVQENEQADRLAVTGAIVDAHMNTTINTFANVEAANERIKRETADMPDMSSLSINSTNLWQHFMGAMLPEITKVIQFCTKLPGFAEIDQEDKIKLIKQGCFEVMVARFCILIDHVKEEMLDPTLQVKAPRNMVQSMPMGPFLDQFFNVANQFNPLGLNDGEIGLFTAILLISPERQSLKNQAAVSALQQLFIQSLYLKLKESHQDAEQTLTSLINLVPVFHKINEDHLKFLKMIKMKSPADFEKKFPALHKELFDTC